MEKMKEPIKNETCPHCGATENVIGKQVGNAMVNPDKISWKSEIIYHVICLNCGTVIRSYVKNPQRLILKNNKKPIMETLLNE